MTAEDFKRRFLPFHPKLYRIAFALVGNSDDAEDILQEAYSKLWMKREELEVVQNPEAFCVTLIKNVCLDYLRSPRANRHEEDITEAYQLSTDSSPERKAEEKEKEKYVSEEVPVDHPVEKKGDDGEARQNGPAFTGDDGIRREFVHSGKLQ